MDGELARKKPTTCLYLETQEERSSIPEFQTLSSAVQQQYAPETCSKESEEVEFPLGTMLDESPTSTIFLRKLTYSIDKSSFYKPIRTKISDDLTVVRNKAWVPKMKEYTQST